MEVPIRDDGLENKVDNIKNYNCGGGGEVMDFT